MQLVLRDPNQGPFLSRVLAFGLLDAKSEEKLDDAALGQIKAKAVLMSLKLADKFYNKYKMHLLEQAAHDVIGVASLGLMALSDHELETALALLKTPDGIMKSFQKGWSMLSTVSKHKLHGKSVYGDVEKNLLEQISSPPDADEWSGWQLYQEALADHRRQESIAALKQHFFVNSQFDPLDCQNLEGVLAEAVLYRILFQGAKVREDLKRRIAKIALEDAWFDQEYLQQQTDKALAELPAELAQTIRQDLGKNFSAGLMRTLNFARLYREQLLKDASPEKLERLEYKEGLSGLLGWPLYLVI
jgi:hypothetical protein